MVMISKKRDTYINKQVIYYIRIVGTRQTNNSSPLIVGRKDASSSLRNVLIMDMGHVAAYLRPACCEIQKVIGTST
jgi:hypothetical protein